MFACLGFLRLDMGVTKQSMTQTEFLVVSRTYSNRHIHKDSFQCATVFMKSTDLPMAPPSAPKPPEVFEQLETAFLRQSRFRLKLVDAKVHRTGCMALHSWPVPRAQPSFAGIKRIDFAAHIGTLERTLKNWHASTICAKGTFLRVALKRSKWNHPSRSRILRQTCDGPQIQRKSHSASQPCAGGMRYLFQDPSQGDGLMLNLSASQLILSTQPLISISGLSHGREAVADREAQCDLLIYAVALSLFACG